MFFTPFALWNKEFEVNIGTVRSDLYMIEQFIQFFNAIASCIHIRGKKKKKEIRSELEKCLKPMAAIDDSLPKQSYLGVVQLEMFQKRLYRL